MIRGVHHTNISTGDLDRLLVFYRDLLGFDVLLENEWGPGNEVGDRIIGLRDTSVRMVMLKAGNTFIEVMEYRNPEGRENDPSRPACDQGLVHLCLDVTDIGAEYERLRANGVPFHCPPQLAGRLYSTYGRDPDGNIFELQELLDADHPMQLSTLPGAGGDDRSAS
jgi:catechol 2,3-dioxygenase-like lactoylglutathione lyase family enzyme